MRENDKTGLGKDLLTTGDVARYLGLKRRTIVSWREKGRGPQYIRISSRCIRYEVDAVLKWLKCQQASA